LKHVRKYVDDVWNCFSSRFVLQVWSLSIIDFKIKIEDYNYKIKNKMTIKIEKAVINPYPTNVENRVRS